MIRELTAGWHRFWFQPQPTSTLAIVRILYGFVVLGWAISLAPDMLHLYGTKGIVPEQTPFSHRYGLFDLSNSDVMAIAVLVGLIVAAVCLLVGYRTRLAAVLVFVFLVSLRDRNGWHMSAGDGLIRMMAFYMMLAPAGVALSVDRWRKARDRFWTFPMRSPWPLRLMQIQIALLYGYTTWAKMRGEAWWEGTATGNVMHVEDLVRMPMPDWFMSSLLISNVLSWGTLAIEASLALLIWNRRLRPYVIGAGILLHLFIEMTMQLGFFSLIIFVGYSTFVPEDTALRLWGRVRRRLANATPGLVRRMALAQSPEEAAERRPEPELVSAQPLSTTRPRS